MQTIAQNFGIVNYLAPVDASGSSLSKSNATFVNMKGYNKVTFIINAGAMTEATTLISAYQAKTASGGSVSATALPITHYWTNVASTSTALLTRTAAASSVVTATSVNNAVYVIEMDAKQLNATSQFTHIGLGITGISAGAMLQVTAILHDARYSADPMWLNPAA